MSVAIAVVMCRYAPAQRVNRVERENACRIAKQLCETVKKLGKLQLEIEPDPESADAINVGPNKAAVLIVPQQGIKEEDKDRPELAAEQGAPFALLFTYHLVPVVDEVPAGEDKLRTCQFTDEDGDQYTVYVFVLGVRRVGKDKFKLLIYGRDKKPLLTVPVEQGKGPGVKPVAVEIRDIVGTEGTCVISAFDKHRASFKLAYRP